jgi:type I restriction enzyme S subunit
MLPKGTVLVAMYGGFNQIGRTGLLTKSASVNQALSAILPNENLMSPYYLLTFLNYKVEDWKEFAASSRKDPNITKKDVERFKLVFPELPEQQKIADFLTQIDNKINQLAQKKQLLERYKKGVMQQIFSQEIRFTDDDGREFPEWELKKIGSIFEERSERGFSDMELLSVTTNDGLKKRSDIEGKDNSSQDKSNYKRVLKNDIAYNSMRMWQGANGVSNFDGIVSPAYTVLKSNKKHNSLFFGFLFKTKEMIKTFERNSQGLTSDTWNLKYPQLAKIKVIVPCYLEQTKIANFLTALDEKIALVEKQLHGTKQYKKGLLQQLFV